MATAGGGNGARGMSDSRPIKRLEEKHLLLLASLLPSRGYREGEPIFPAGITGSEIFIVSQGKVKLHHALSDGRELIFEEASPGDFFGEVAAILQGPRTAAATAIAETEVLLLDAARLEEILNHIPELGAVLVQSMARRLRRSSEQIVFLQSSRSGPAGQRPAARIPEFIGSPWFLLSVAVVLMFWSFRAPHIDPNGLYLGLFLSVLQIIVVVLVLRSQTETARYEEQIDLREREANLAAEAEISALHRKFDEQRHDLDIRMNALRDQLARLLDHQGASE